MKKLLSIAILTLATATAAAQIPEDSKEWSNDWFVGGQIGGAMAFGDDSYNVFDDFSKANGSNLSLFAGKHILPFLAVRARVGRAKLYSRVNLETYDAYHVDYPDLFPRRGFYGYQCLYGNAEVMVNVLNIFMRPTVRTVDIYLVGGVGFNHIDGYDDHVANWTEEADILPGGYYYVDTDVKSSPQAVIGGQIDVRLGRNLSLNLEAIGTFTSDNMEGIQYEESYDVYITGSIGLTYRF